MRISKTMREHKLSYGLNGYYHLTHLRSRTEFQQLSILQTFSFHTQLTSSGPTLDFILEDV